ncbi:hypothetical protein D9758_012692 [Tetrapyrgos nigripes]|uniref:Uncharacterized protein n=1 Tax=Tetrapyrgos nigripes TaxID=182062 RepID=A0A8H5CW00_9AGAR|nr:hypothetical protein D9758_012692 [Tetrapyrgos nigripes]
MQKLHLLVHPGGSTFPLVAMTLIEVVIEIEYTRDAWLSLDGLPPKELAKRLRTHLNALKLPHPSEETISRKGWLNSVRFSWTKPRGSYLHKLVRDFVRDQDVPSTKVTKRQCGMYVLLPSRSRGTKLIGDNLQQGYQFEGRETSSYLGQGPTIRKYSDPPPSRISSSYPDLSKYKPKRFVELTVYVTYTRQKAEVIFGRPAFDDDPDMKRKGVASRLREDLHGLNIPNPPESSIYVDYPADTVSFSWTTEEGSPLYTFLDELIYTKRNDEAVMKARHASSIEAIRMTEDPKPPYRPRQISDPKPRSPSPCRFVSSARRHERSLSPQTSASDFKGASSLRHFFPNMKQDSPVEETRGSRPMPDLHDTESISASSSPLLQSLPLAQNQPPISSSIESPRRRRSIQRIETVQTKLLQLEQASLESIPHVDQETPVYARHCEVTIMTEDAAAPLPQSWKRKRPTFSRIETDYARFLDTEQNFKKKRAEDVEGTLYPEEVTEPEWTYQEVFDNPDEVANEMVYLSGMELPVNKNIQDDIGQSSAESADSGAPVSTTQSTSVSSLSVPPSAHQHVAIGSQSQISQLTREFWDMRRTLAALSTKAGLLQSRLRTLGVVDQYHGRSAEDIEASLSVVGRRYKEERQTCERLERLLGDVEREIKEPVIVPALLAALQPDISSARFVIRIKYSPQSRMAQWMCTGSTENIASKLRKDLEYLKLPFPPEDNTWTDNTSNSIYFAFKNLKKSSQTMITTIIKLQETDFRIKEAKRACSMLASNSSNSPQTQESQTTPTPQIRTENGQSELAAVLPLKTPSCPRAMQAEMVDSARDDSSSERSFVELLPQLKRLDMPLQSKSNEPLFVQTKMIDATGRGPSGGSTNYHSSDRSPKELTPLPVQTHDEPLQPTDSPPSITRPGNSLTDAAELDGTKAGPVGDELAHTVVHPRKRLSEPDEVSPQQTKCQKVSYTQTTSSAVIKPVKPNPNALEIASLSREFWNNRRTMTSLSSKAIVLEAKMRHMGAKDESEQKYLYASTKELEEKVFETERLLEEEHKKREQLEMLVKSVEQECENPVVVPALLAAFNLPTLHQH